MKLSASGLKGCCCEQLGLPIKSPAKRRSSSNVFAAWLPTMNPWENDMDMAFHSCNVWVNIQGKARSLNEESQERQCSWRWHPYLLQVRQRRWQENLISFFPFGWLEWETFTKIIQPLINSMLFAPLFLFPFLFTDSSCLSHLMHILMGLLDSDRLLVLFELKDSSLSQYPSGINPLD